MGETIYFGVYADNGLYFDTNEETEADFEAALGSKLKITIMCNISFYLKVHFEEWKFVFSTLRGPWNTSTMLRHLQ